MTLVKSGSNAAPEGSSPLGDSQTIAMLLTRRVRTGQRVTALVASAALVLAILSLQPLNIPLLIAGITVLLVSALSFLRLTNKQRVGSEIARSPGLVLAASTVALDQQIPGASLVARHSFLRLRLVGGSTYEV